MSGGNRSRGGWGWLWFPCGIAHCGFHKVVSCFFFSCVGTEPPIGENAVLLVFFFFLCGHLGPPGGESAVGLNAVLLVFFCVCVGPWPPRAANFKSFGNS